MLCSNKYDSFFLSLFAHVYYLMRIKAKFQNSLKEELNKILNEANIFINEKQAYLHKLKINDEEIKVFNKESEDLQTALNEKSKKLKNSIFDNKLIKFLSNVQNINQFEIGNFNYEQLEPSVSKFF